MAFKAPRVKKINNDISRSIIYLRSIKKWGKTTTFRDVVLEKFGDPECGLHINCGNEDSTAMLDEINSTTVTSWKEIKEMERWLASDDPAAKKIKMIAFDTVDELVVLAEKEAIRVHNATSDGELKTSINAIMGGYGAGMDYVVEELIEPLINRLNRKMGLGVWIIGHTKFREKPDKSSVNGNIMQLTANIKGKYDVALAGISNIVVTGTIEYDVKEVKKKVGTTYTTEKYKASEDVRKLYFRGTETVDAGSYFSSWSGIPVFMIFEPDKNNAAEFIKIVEEGMKKSSLKYRPEEWGKLDLAEKSEPAELRMKEQGSETVETDIPSLIKQIKSKFNNADEEKQKEAKVLIKKHNGLGNINDVEILYEILSVFK